jgi:hypothetical protein
MALWCSGGIKTWKGDRDFSYVREPPSGSVDWRSETEDWTLENSMDFRWYYVTLYTGCFKYSEELYV